MKMLISIVAPCFNEQDNISEFYNQVCIELAKLKNYDFEIIFIDNASTDLTVPTLKKLAEVDKRVKVIINMRNFGQVRSPYWAVMQSSGDATIVMASDLQDPPNMIPKFISEWELGWKIVLAVKPVSKTGFLMHSIRKFYYRFLDFISEVPLIQDATGFGIYDRLVLNHIREIGDPYPYFRGLICELGFPIKSLQFHQPRRLRGISSNNFYSLYDMAMLGIVSHSLIPLRIASFLGFLIGAGSLITAIIYLTMKLVLWNQFPMGQAPLVIGLFFMFGMLFFFIGLLGEYIGSIHTYVRNRPIVIEKERINF